MTEPLKFQPTPAYKDPAFWIGFGLQTAFTSGQVLAQAFSSDPNASLGFAIGITALQSATAIFQAWQRSRR